jgi:hypothetical protein
MAVGRKYTTDAGCDIGLIIAYGINSAQNAMMKCTSTYPTIFVRLLTFRLADEWKNDPRNPTLKNKVGPAH